MTWSLFIDGMYFPEINSEYIRFPHPITPSEAGSLIAMGYAVTVTNNSTTVGLFNASTELGTELYLQHLPHENP